MVSYFDHFIITHLIFNYITDTSIIVVCTIILYTILSRKDLIVPNRFQSIMELSLEHWKSVVSENLGSDHEIYSYYLWFLFIFLFGVNLLGFMIYIFPVTTHICITFGLAFSLWFCIVILAFKNFKWNTFSMFLPSGSPLGMSPLLVIIEIVSNISRPVALGMRLAANLTAGHILVTILGDFGIKLVFIVSGLPGLISVIIILLMVLLVIGVLVIQAYVFCLLLMIYLKDSLYLH